MKRASKKLGIFIIIVGIAIIATIIYYAYSIYQSMPNNFTQNRKNIGEKLYNSVMEQDLDNQYPDEPQNVMELYKNTVFLLYGDIITNDELIKDVIRVQRRLLSDEILGATSEQQQFENLKSSLDALYNNKVRVTGLEVTSTNYDQFDTNICIVNMSEYAVNLNRIEWNYYLIKDETGRWKIHTWELIGY